MKTEEFYKELNSTITPSVIMTIKTRDELIEEYINRFDLTSVDLKNFDLPSYGTCDISNMKRIEYTMSHFNMEGNSSNLREYISEQVGFGILTKIKHSLTLIHQNKNFNCNPEMIGLDQKIKPPLGILSRTNWDGQRLQDLINAFSRYTQAKKEIPNEWIIEYNELARKQNDLL
jgi:hypothetical protein